jgi:hypothetical protein
MKQSTSPVSLCLALLLCGCTTAPTAPDGSLLGPSDFGPRPDDPAAIVAEHLRTRLRDPYSAQIEVRGLNQVTVKGSLITRAAFGWGICAGVNAKNAYGGYSGFKNVVVVWRQGSGVVSSYGDLGPNMFDEGAANALCQSIGGR